MSQREEALLEALWSESGEVYVLLDGARDGRIYDLVRRSGLDSRCLLGPNLSPSLARKAPHLVSLGRRSLFSRQLLELGWGRGWGLFLTSEALIQEVNRHLQRFLEVRDPGGRTLMLRLWDPRVLQAFLPVCTREELAFVFGPIHSFALESDGGARLQRFSLIQDSEAEGFLEERLYGLSGSSPELVSRSLVAGHRRGADPRRRGRIFHLRQPHWEALRGLVRQSFVEHSLRIIARCWPHTYRSRGAADLRRFVQRGIAQAQGYGVTGRRSVLHFLNLMLTFGEDFDRLPWAVDLLERTDLRATTRMELVLERAYRRMEAEHG